MVLFSALIFQQFYISTIPPLFRAIQESPSHMCKTCRHLMLEHELEAQKWQHCPLCHSTLIISGNK